jgi:hypothetical protein
LNVGPDPLDSGGRGLVAQLVVELVPVALPVDQNVATPVRSFRRLHYPGVDVMAANFGDFFTKFSAKNGVFLLKKQC